jgi:hypothetical protein
VQSVTEPMNEICGWRMLDGAVVVASSRAMGGFSFRCGWLRALRALTTNIAIARCIPDAAGAADAARCDTKVSERDSIDSNGARAPVPGNIFSPIHFASCALRKVSNSAASRRCNIIRHRPAWAPIGVNSQFTLLRPIRR